MKAISIILPIYNVENYIGKCLDSIINQSFQDFELIVIDDCGNDSSIELCKAILFESTIDYKIIHNSVNMGLSESRNVGINTSRGKYITFIDSDDWIQYDMLEKLYQTSIVYNSDIVSCGSFEYWEGNKTLVAFHNVEAGSYTSDQFLYTLFNGRTNIAAVAWAKLYKRELFKNIFFPKGVIYEDILTIPYIIRKSNKVTQIEDKLYFYLKRSAPTSITSSKPINISGFLENLYILKRDFESHKTKNLSNIFFYKNLLGLTYGLISFSKKYSDIKKELKLVSSLIFIKDFFPNRHFMKNKHIIYLIIMRLNNYFYYYSFKKLLFLKK